MNKNYLNFKAIIVAITFLFFTIIAWFFFDINMDAYERGYRYWVLITELIVLPLFYVGVTIQLIRNISSHGMIDWTTVKLMAKYFGLLILLIVVFFFMAMFFN